MVGKSLINFQGDFLFVNSTFFFNYDKFPIRHIFFTSLYLTKATEYLSKHLNVHIIFTPINLCMESFWLIKHWTEKRNTIRLMYKGRPTDMKDPRIKKLISEKSIKKSTPNFSLKKNQKKIVNFFSQKFTKKTLDISLLCKQKDKFLSVKSGVGLVNKFRKKIPLSELKQKKKEKKLFSVVLRESKQNKFVPKNRIEMLINENLQIYIAKIVIPTGALYWTYARHNQIRRYKSNQFFGRVFDVLFCLFKTNVFDIKIITRIIAYELRVLRKMHRPFLLFIKSVFTLFLKVFPQTLITSMQIVLKGRITPGRRQKTRKQKHLILLGKYLRSKITNVNTDFYESQAIHRYGIINVQLSCSYFKVKVWTSINIHWLPSIKTYSKNYFYKKWFLNKTKKKTMITTLKSFNFKNLSLKNYEVFLRNSIFTKNGEQGLFSYILEPFRYFDFFVFNKFFRDRKKNYNFFVVSTFFLFKLLFNKKLQLSSLNSKEFSIPQVKEINSITCTQTLVEYKKKMIFFKRIVHSVLVGSFFAFNKKFFKNNYYFVNKFVEFSSFLLKFMNFFLDDFFKTSSVFNLIESSFFINDKRKSILRLKKKNQIYLPMRKKILNFLIHNDVDSLERNNNKVFNLLSVKKDNLNSKTKQFSKLKNLSLHNLKKREKLLHYNI